MEVILAAESFSVTSFTLQSHRERSWDHTAPTVKNPLQSERERERERERDRGRYYPWESGGEMLRTYPSYVSSFHRTTGGDATVHTKTGAKNLRSKL